MLCRMFPLISQQQLAKQFVLWYVRMLEEWGNVVWIIMQYFSCNVQRRKTAYPAVYNKGHRSKVTGHTSQITGHSSGAGVRALLTRLRTSLAMLLVSLESIPTSDKKKNTKVKIIAHFMVIWKRDKRTCHQGKRSWVVTESKRTWQRKLHSGSINHVLILSDGLGLACNRGSCEGVSLKKMNVICIWKNNPR